MISIFKKSAFFFLFLLPFSSVNLYAQDSDRSAQHYPNLSGKVLFEFRGDHISSSTKKGISANNAIINIEPFISLNLNNNWSIKTNWKIIPIIDRNNVTPERWRTILGENRGFTPEDEGLIIEEIKGQFQNEDLRLVFGKFNPEFGSAFLKEKRIGIFTTDFTKDYELREKIGASITALFENSEITASGFFNDNTELSNSAINQRGRESRSDGIAGNTSTPSSYSVALKGSDIFDINDLSYNLGYRHLAVDNIDGRNDENALVAGGQYSWSIGYNAALVPFIEIVKINNFGGEKDRNALYSTASLTLKYINWNIGFSNITRDIKRDGIGASMISDHQWQYFVGYKITNNLTIDVSRMDLKENGYKAVIVGALLSYIYRF